MNPLNHLFRSSKMPSPPMGPPAAGAWTAPAVMSWFDSLEREGKGLPLTERFHWQVPRRSSVPRPGPVIDWAIDERATCVVERLVKAGMRWPWGGERWYGEQTGPLERLAFSSSVHDPDVKAVPIAALLHAAGVPVHHKHLEGAVFREDEPLAHFFLEHLPDGEPPQQGLAKTAASVGSSDALMGALIAAGLRFERDDLCTNISFQPSAGDDAARWSRVARWTGMLDAHAIGRALPGTAEPRPRRVRM